MDTLEWIVLGFSIYAVLQIAFIVGLEIKHPPRRGARSEKGQGIVPSAMQNDMDRG